MAEIVIPGRDNRIVRQLRNDKRDGKGSLPLTVEEMQAITRIDIVINGQTITSTGAPGAFDWSTREAEAVVIIDLSQQGLPAGTDLNAVLFVYDANNINGIRWGFLPIKVEQA